LKGILGLASITLYKLFFLIFRKYLGKSKLDVELFKHTKIPEKRWNSWFWESRWVTIWWGSL